MFFRLHFVHMTTSRVSQHLYRCCISSVLNQTRKSPTLQITRFFHKVKSSKMSDYSSIVYKSVDSILEELKKPENFALDPVRQLVALYERVYEEETAKHISESTHALVVLEGLDGCGKSTATKRLTKTLEAEPFGTPPACLLTLRPLFDGDEYKTLRPLFYSLGNYIAALQMKTILQTKPILLDRYWYSTACYAIAQAIQDNPEDYKMPPDDSDVFLWPSDLLRPNVVLYLTVSERSRAMRMKNRELTMQESLLATQERFRKNVGTLYAKMKNPKVIFVNGERSKRNTELGLLEHIRTIPEFANVFLD